DGTRELGWEGRIVEAPGQVSGDVPLVEELERDLLAQAVDPQLLHERAQGMPCDDDVHRPVAYEDENASRLLPAGEHPEQVERRVVAPVEVLEHEHDWRAGAQGLDGLRHLAQHALLGDAEQVPTKEGRIARPFEPGELNEPGRGMSLEDVEHAPST